MSNGPAETLPALPAHDGAFRRFPAVAERLISLALVVLRGLGQVALVETPAAGALVLASIALVNPWSALGALAGAALGTLPGYRYRGYRREEWRLGLAGFNLAVVGILAGGAVATGTWRVDAILIAVALCMAMEFAMRRSLRQWALPVLTMPATLATIFTSAMLAPAGTWLWVSPGQSPLGTTGVALAVVCVVLAMASKSLSATLQVAMLTVVAMFVSQAMGVEPLDLTGLWAFTIAPASFTVHAVFMGGSLLGGIAGLTAAAIGATVWLLWYVTGLGNVAPPMLAPFVVGVWCALLLFRRLGQPAILQPAFWQAVAAIWISGSKGKHLLVLVADEPNSSASSIPYPSGVVYRQDLIHCRDWRQEWWRICNDQRQQKNYSRPDGCSKAIARLQRRGFVHAAATFSRDGRLARAGVSDVVQLQGDLNSVKCVGCHSEHSWPPADIWRTCDLRCSDCGNFIMPGFPMTRRGFQSAWKQVDSTLSSDDLVLLIGTIEDSRAARAVLDGVRGNGARMINVTPAPSSTPLRMGEILVRGDIDAVMQALAYVLAALAVLLRGPRRDAMSVKTPLQDVDC